MRNNDTWSCPVGPDISTKNICIRHTLIMSLADHLALRPRLRSLSRYQRHMRTNTPDQLYPTSALPAPTYFSLPCTDLL